MKPIFIFIFFIISSIELYQGVNSTTDFSQLIRDYVHTNNLNGGFIDTIGKRVLFRDSPKQFLWNKRSAKDFLQNLKAYAIRRNKRDTDKVLTQPRYLCHVKCGKTVCTYCKRESGFFDHENSLNGGLYGLYTGPYGKRESGFFDHENSLNGGLYGLYTGPYGKRESGFFDHENSLNGGLYGLYTGPYGKKQIHIG